jgi:hypothetical protein
MVSEVLADLQVPQTSRHDGGYPYVVIDAADALVAARYDGLGRDAVAPLFPTDDTHTSREGARLTAATAAAALGALPGSPVASYLSMAR